jgi:thiosulfate dehydrogenase [quinone] large subunit
METGTLNDGRAVVVNGRAMNVAALLRITLGLVYLWAFVSQGFGITYTNSTTSSTGEVSYGWHFDVDADAGWISSGFTHSPTGPYVDKTHGPLSFIPKDLPTGLDDLGWMFAIGGLGVALTLGICMGIAGWGGFLLNILLWFSSFPPTSNPVFDATHTTLALALLLLMYLHAGDRWGLGRWWRRHTPKLLH